MSKYAVLIPWVKTESGDALLFEVRSQKVRQPGEVCFPGGRVEPGETAVEAAVRETCEELGITADEVVDVTELEPLVMGDGRAVYPATARLKIGGAEVLSASGDEIAGLKLSEDEVAEVFLLPAEWLAEHGLEHFDLSITSDEELPDQLLAYLERYGNYRHTGETDWLEYEGHGIWGLTARIIKKYCAAGSCD
jgi:8-oxo-dGTP pyrophosphatase MutT (NUDIX family)